MAVPVYVPRLALASEIAPTNDGARILRPQRGLQALGRRVFAEEGASAFDEALIAEGVEHEERRVKRAHSVLSPAALPGPDAPPWLRLYRAVGWRAGRAVA